MLAPEDTKTEAEADGRSLGWGWGSSVYPAAWSMGRGNTAEVNRMEKWHTTLCSQRKLAVEYLKLEVSEKRVRDPCCPGWLWVRFFPIEDDWWSFSSPLILLVIR